MGVWTEKGQTFDVIRKWWANTARVRARFPLLSLMRDNASKNQIPELRKFCEERGIAKRYSTPYSMEQLRSLYESLED